MEGTDFKTETRQFMERIKAKHQPEELLAWAQKLMEAHKDDKGPYYMPHEEKPAFILILDPPFEPYVTVFPGSHVMVDWGGGFGHWGLIVATTHAPDNPMLYTIEWMPGVYVYHTNQ